MPNVVHPHWTRLICALGLLLMAVSAVMAQNGSNADVSSSPNRYLLRRTVRRVIVDVVVTDAQGKAVSGLVEKDFSITENGSPQRVLSFEAHDFPALTDAALPKLPTLPVNTFVNVPTEPERGPLYVIVYDALNMTTADQANARKQLVDFLASKPAGTRFALFAASDGFHLVQGFTADPKLLLAAFDHRGKHSHLPWVFLYGRNFGEGDFSLALQEITFLGHYLEGLPGRKNVIWMSTRMPVRLGLAGPAGAFFGQLDSEFADNAQEQMKEAVNALNAAQVSLYPVDVAGPDPDVPGIDVIADEIAEDTGGHAYYNTNDIKGALDQATERGSSYYELSYSPTEQKYDGNLRKIVVELAVKGCHLAYRRGYYAIDENSPATRRKQMAEITDHPFATKRTDPLVAHLEHGAPMDHQLLFRADVRTLGAPSLATPAQMANLISEAAYLRARRRNSPVKVPAPIQLQTYAVDYTLLDRGLRRQAASLPVLEFAAAAYDDDGQLLNGIVQPATRMPPEVRAETNEKGIFRIEQTLDVPAKAVWLRVAVRDLTTDRVGTLEIPLPLASDQANGGLAPAIPALAHAK